MLKSLLEQGERLEYQEIVYEDSVKLERGNNEKEKSDYVFRINNDAGRLFTRRENG